MFGNNLKYKTMFNLKRKVKQIVQSFEPVKDPQVVIAEIHNSFDTASEKLLNDAKVILAGSYDIEKGERLKKIGFVSAKKAVEASTIISEKQKNEELAKLIEYYQMNYPNNKFITEEKTKEICQKYGLLCAETKYYISDVPEKNLSEIENFKLKETEMEKIEYGWMKWERTAHGGYLMPSSKKDEAETHHFEKPDLKICASVKDFYTKNMRIEDGYKLELNLPDPIVLQPVKGGYLVVSKWGLEAEDADLINEKMN
jgi:hypothetical protein